MNHTKLLNECKCACKTMFDEQHSSGQTISIWIWWIYVRLIMYFVYELNEIANNKLTVHIFDSNAVSCIYGLKWLRSPTRSQYAFGNQFNLNNDYNYISVESHCTHTTDSHVMSTFPCSYIQRNNDLISMELRKEKKQQFKREWRNWYEKSSAFLVS